jgi:hypothetical protein
VLLDTSSVEIFAAGGQVVITDQLVMAQPWTLEISGDYTVIDELTVADLTGTRESVA